MCSTVAATSADVHTGSAATRPSAWRTPVAASARSCRSPRCRCRSGRRRCGTAGRPATATSSVRSSRAWSPCTARECGRGVCAEIDPLLMIRPPCGSCSFICRYAACAHRNAPLRLTSTTCRHCLVREVLDRHAAGPNVPALLNSRSSPPNRPTPARTARPRPSGRPRRSARRAPRPRRPPSPPAVRRRPASATDQPAATAPGRPPGRCRTPPRSRPPPCPS